jgi:hypothetical protein
MTDAVSLKLKYLELDNGYCRAYYKGPNRSLYCFQEAARGTYELLVCTRDGEPSHPIGYSSVLLDTLPPDDGSRTAVDFTAWAKDNLKIQPVVTRASFHLQSPK